METVKELRQAGWKVGVYHNRKKRKTEVEVTDPEGRTVKGTAKASKADQWVKKLGVRIALGRALKELDRGNFVTEEPHKIEVDYMRCDTKNGPPRIEYSNPFYQPSSIDYSFSKF